MKFLILRVEKITLLCLLSLTLAITACGQSTASQLTSLDSGYASFTYEDVSYKIISMAEQSSFNDDSTTGASFVVRVAVQETNSNDGEADIAYNDAFLLILPDGDSIPVSAEETSSFLKSGMVRNNWLDFPLNDQQDLNKLVLRVGMSGERQMNIPLAKHANLSSYQPETITPKQTLQYGGVNWTITKVIAGLSADGKQAEAGMRYITVELSVDNPGSNAFYPQPDNTFNLQAPDTTQFPADSVIPSTIAAVSKDTNGVVYFLMPENDTQLTLDFLARPFLGIQAVSTSFRVPLQS